MKTIIKNARLVTRDSVIDGACLLFENDTISYIGKDECCADKVIDVKGSYAVPGFVDIHCHGCLGLAFNGASEDEVKKIANYHLAHGTTTLIASTSTSEVSELESSLEAISNVIKDGGADSLSGIFMEGPWLSAAAAGAQASVFMRKPSADELRLLKSKYPHLLRVGAAPELDGADSFAETSVELGIVASIAHTDASFSDVEKSMKHGYKLMTHLYSGMRGTERKNAYRIAGAVEAGLYFDDMFVEIIADGKHLPYELLRYIYKFKGADRICLITDAIRAAGLPNGSSTIGVSKVNNAHVWIEDDVAWVNDRSCFAGSTATTDRLYRTMADAIGRDMPSLSRMASLTPAHLMGFYDRGELAVGKRADIVILDDALGVEQVIIGGKEV